jgi:hypothetical protein
MATIVKKKKKAKEDIGSLFLQTEYAFLVRIAETTKDFDTVAGYLAIARHGDMKGKYGEEWRHSGSGAKKISKALVISEMKSKQTRDNLLAHGFISPVPTENRVSAHCEYILGHGELDIALPFKTVDGSNTTVQSVIDRIRNGTASRLTGRAYHVPEDEKLDTLMTFITCHLPKYFDMANMGGINPLTAIFNKWDSRQVPYSNCVRWEAERVNTCLAYPEFYTKCLSYRISGKQKDNIDLAYDAFLKAWAHLIGLGLVYEVATLFSDPYKTLNATGKAIMSLDVYDYHANTTQDAVEAQRVSVKKVLTGRESFVLLGESMKSGKTIAELTPYEEKVISATPSRTGDPCYMREVIKAYGTYRAFSEHYSSPNEQCKDIAQDALSLRVDMPRGFNPDNKYSTVGVYRLRFRMANGGGEFLARENANIKECLSRLEPKDAD